MFRRHVSAISTMSARDSVMKQSPRIFALIITLFMCASVPLPACAEVLQAANSRVTLDVPDGFVPAARYAGFEDTGLQSSFVIVEMPDVAFEQLKAGLTPEALATKGILKAKSGSLKRSDDHVYFTAEQESAGGPVAKFMLAFRDQGVTALITGNVPKAMIDTGKITRAQIEPILESAKIAAVATEDVPLFTLDYLGPFKKAGALAGTAKAYTLDGVLDPGTKTPGRTMFIIAPSLDNRLISDPHAFARSHLMQQADAKDVKINKSRETKISGMEGVILNATAQAEGGEPQALSIYHVLLVNPKGGYFVMVGRTADVDPTAMFGEFEKMSKSFKAAP
jgi:hypothetical protein